MLAVLSCHWFIATRLADQAIVSVRWLRRVRPSGAPRSAPLRGSGTGRRSAAWGVRPGLSGRRPRGDEFVVVERGPPCSPYWTASAPISASKPIRSSPLGLSPGERLACWEPSPRASAARRTVVPASWPPLRPAPCASEKVVDLVGGLVEEGPGPEDDLHALGAGERPQGPSRLPRASAATGHCPTGSPPARRAGRRRSSAPACCRSPLTSTSIGSSPKLS